MSNIRREERPGDALVPPLDENLFAPSDKEWDFLRQTVSSDQANVREVAMRVQRESYEKYPYPCIRAFHFVSLFMCDNAAYERVLEAGEKGNTRLLDLGCCMGTDVRKAVIDGYPASNIIGSDLRREYIDLGLDTLFADREMCPIRFIEADIFDVSIPSTFPESNSETLAASSGPEGGLAQFLGQITHVYLGALFHLFDEETQYAIALRVALLMERHRADGVEAVAFGRHSGLEKEGMIADRMQRARYGHSPSSWARLWKRVFTELEGVTFAEERVKVEAKMGPHPAGTNAVGQGARMMWWSVTIIGEDN